MRKKIIAIMLVMALVAILAPAIPAMAANSGTVNGAFTIGSPVAIGSITITGSPTSLTPQTAYTVNVPVTKTTIDTVTSLIVKIYHNTGSTPTYTEFNATAASAQNCAVITWSHTAGSGTSSTVLTPGSTTWSLGAYTVPGSSDYSSGSFTFVFPVTIGTVATETGTTDKWQVAAYAVDSSSGTDYKYMASAVTMDYYGAITVPSASVNWGTIAAGTLFTDAAAAKNIASNFVYVSNGNYAKKVYSSNWSDGGSATMTLDGGGTTSAANTFALKANTANSVTSAYVVQSSPVVIDNTGAQTAEAGNTVNPMYLWLQVSGSITTATTYSGTVTYTISTR